MTLNQLLLGGMAAIVSAVSAHATSITFATPTGSSTSGPVDATATFTPGAGTLTVVVTNLNINPTDDAQAISGLEFTLDNGATVGTLASSFGQPITITSPFSVPATATSTPWVLDTKGGLELDALGHGQLKGLIIGAPDPTQGYSNANGSIAGSSAHNPFTFETATFTMAIVGITATDQNAVTSATFNFGTMEGVDRVTGQLVPNGQGSDGGGGRSDVAPEPTSLLLLGLGLTVVGIPVYRKSRSARYPRRSVRVWERAL